MRLRSRRREGLSPGTWTIGSCKHPASAYSEGCAVREREDTHSKDHPRNEGGDEETVRHGLCEVCRRLTERAECGGPGAVAEAPTGAVMCQ